MEGLQHMEGAVRHSCYATANADLQYSNCSVQQQMQPTAAAAAAVIQQQQQQMFFTGIVAIALYLAKQSTHASSRARALAPVCTAATAAANRTAQTRAWRNGQRENWTGIAVHISCIARLKQ
jgi:hypothetical protein